MDTTTCTTARERKLALRAVLVPRATVVLLSAGEWSIVVPTTTHPQPGLGAVPIANPGQAVQTGAVVLASEFVESNLHLCSQNPILVKSSELRGFRCKREQNFISVQQSCPALTSFGVQVVLATS